MVMMVYGQDIPCARAEKSTDFVRAYDENGECIFEAANVKSFEGYTLDGGEWSEAVPTQIDRIDAQVAYTALMTDTLMESEG